MTLLQQSLVLKNTSLDVETQQRFAHLERMRVAFVEEMEEADRKNAEAVQVVNCKGSSKNEPMLTKRKGGK